MRESKHPMASQGTLIGFEVAMLGLHQECERACNPSSFAIGPLLAQKGTVMPPKEVFAPCMPKATPSRS
jgi:hypothetical protein